MTTVKSPGGSLFPYYYKGGEIHCLKYGSFSNDEKALFSIMEEEEEFIKKPNRRLRIWVDFYETELTDNVWKEFIQSTYRLSDYIIKLAVVGCTPADQWRFKRLTRKLNIDLLMPVKFFRDPEDAKTWLVGEPDSGL